MSTRSEKVLSARHRSHGMVVGYWKVPAWLPHELGSSDLLLEPRGVGIWGFFPAKLCFSPFGIHRHQRNAAV